MFSLSSYLGSAVHRRPAPALPQRPLPLAFILIEPSSIIRMIRTSGHSGSTRPYQMGAL